MTTHDERGGLELIASRRHTAGLLLIIGSFALAGRVLVAHQSAAALEEFGRTRIYLIALASEWVLFIYLLLGLRRQVTTVRKILDESSWTMGRWILYAAIAVGTAVVWMVCGFAIGKVLQPSPEEIRHLQVLLPRSDMEKALWVVLSTSAGFCEEFLYRGYLLQQFQRWTGRTWAGVVLQAMVYGIAHAALPWQIAVMVTCLGLLLGGVAAWRKSLAPGMLLHASFDILAGFLSVR